MKLFISLSFSQLGQSFPTCHFTLSLSFVLWEGRESLVLARLVLTFELYPQSHILLGLKFWGSRAWWLKSIIPDTQEKRLRSGGWSFQASSIKKLTGSQVNRKSWAGGHTCHPSYCKNHN
jgi:hypothetical protein